jgi:hypothetical protein
VPNRQQGARLTTDGPPRAVLVTALAVAVAAITAVLAVAVMTRRSEKPQPVAIPPVPAPQAGGPDCAGLMSALPSQLGDNRRIPPADPAPPGTAAWRADNDEPVVLRCGLTRPPDLVVGSPIQVVNGVQWFQVADSGRSTWFTVDRPVYVALTLPHGRGPTPIQQLSDLIAKTLAPVPIQLSLPGRPPGP